MKPSVAVVLLAAGWLGGAGCMSSSSGGGAAPMTDDGAAPLAEPALSALLADGAFRGAGFVQMNPSPFPSTLTPGSFVTVYVSQDAAAAYEAVTPETSTRGADFPVGGILVRQVSDSAGNVTMLSTMLERESGFFPTGGDFFFGLTDVHGQPLVDNGLTEWGALALCAGCHASRASSGYLFGVSDSVRGTLAPHADAGAP